LYPERMTNQITWAKPDPPPNALHTAFTHAHETLLWASKGRSARHTFNYDLINSLNPTSQISSVWRLPAVPMREKSHGRHPTQKPLRLVRRAVLASSAEDDLVFDPFCGSGTTGVAAKELGRFFVGAEKEGEYAELAARRIGAVERGKCYEGYPAPKMYRSQFSGAIRVEAYDERQRHCPNRRRPRQYRSRQRSPLDSAPPLRLAVVCSTRRSPLVDF
jgi:DNA methylase